MLVAVIGCGVYMPTVIIIVYNLIMHALRHAMLTMYMSSSLLRDLLVLKPT